MKEPEQFRIIIIDDEPNVRIALKEILTQQFPAIKIAAEAGNVPDGVKEIQKHKPDLIFLDIEMPGYSGLQLLEFFEEDQPEFEIIFVTAYNEYAIQAFKVSAFDYLLKPVNPEELKSAINRFSRLQKNKNNSERIKLLKESYQSEVIPEQLAISSNNGYDFIRLPEVILFEADGSYTSIMQSDGSKIISSKPLGEFEDMLKNNRRFFRAHRSFLINLAHIMRVDTSEGDVIIMKGGTGVPLSRYRKKDFEILISSIKI